MADIHLTLPEGTKTDPVVAAILMGLSKRHSFARAFEDRREVRIIKVDDSMPDRNRMCQRGSSRPIRKPPPNLLVINHIKRIAPCAYTR